MLFGFTDRVTFEDTNKILIKWSNV